MASGWRYRALSVGGTAVIAVLAVAVADLDVVRQAFTYLPVVGHLPFETTWRAPFALEAATTAVVVLAAMAPLYKPRPRRIPDLVGLAGERTLMACISLAAIGYFNYSYRLPRAKLIVAGTVLLIALPTWFLLLTGRVRSGLGRTVVIGDDPGAVDRVLDAHGRDAVGYIAPTPIAAEFDGADPAVAPNGGHEPMYLGGFARLREHLVENDIDSAVLAFSDAARSEFFDMLATCSRNGVGVKTLRQHADDIFVGSTVDQEGLVDVDLQPWDWQDYVLKRCFDLAFATAMLAVTLPLWLIVPLAIKLEDGGQIFYRQERTTTFGDTFTISKFRTMRPGDGSPDPSADESARVTRVGAVLRRTHIDELPQLVTVLGGQMSVVGPRPTWTDEEQRLASLVDEWRKRWFVKPGLTGLAQIRGATSTDPDEKLVQDLEYIRRQSLLFDLRIVGIQLWLVAADFATFLRERE